MSHILKNFDYFYDSDMPLLKVSTKTNVYYVDLGENKYITYENIDSASSKDGNNIEYYKSYYDVVTGVCVLKNHEIRDFNNNILYSDSNARIINLSEVFNLHENEFRLLSLDDIFSITNFEENQIVKKKTLGQGESLF